MRRHASTGPDHGTAPHKSKYGEAHDERDGCVLTGAESGRSACIPKKIGNRERGTGGSWNFRIRPNLDDGAIKIIDEHRRQILTAALIAEGVAITFCYNGLIASGVIRDANLVGAGGTAVSVSANGHEGNLAYFCNKKSITRRRCGR
jgi:hypothetical protein